MPAGEVRSYVGYGKAEVCTEKPNPPGRTSKSQTPNSGPQMPPELLTFSEGIFRGGHAISGGSLGGDSAGGTEAKVAESAELPPQNDEHPNRLGGDFGSGIAVQLVFGLASFRYGCFGHNGSRLFDQLFAEKAFRRCMVNALFCWAGLLVGLP